MKEGDVVYLNSGSPELTVENVNGNFVKCIWFNDGSVESGTFHKACLKVQQAENEAFTVFQTIGTNQYE
jgi:uncharacterized protein YodC (DUF2158 family)